MTRHDVPVFPVRSESFAEGQTLPAAQRSGKMRAGGQDESPQLSWSGAPAGTKGYAVTMFDPDAPGRGGFWHWAVLDVPADVTSLPAGAGAEGGRLLPAGRHPVEERRRVPRLPGRRAASRTRAAPVRHHRPRARHRTFRTQRAHRSGQPGSEAVAAHPGPRHAHRHLRTPLSPPPPACRRARAPAAELAGTCPVRRDCPANPTPVRRTRRMPPRGPAAPAHVDWHYAAGSK